MLFRIGKLCIEDFLDLQSLLAQLLERAQLPMFCGKKFVAQLSSTTKHLLHRLEYIATDYFTMRLGVHEVQRAFLELTSVLDYKEHMISLPDTLAKLRHNIMGAFTFELEVCEKLFQARIPVWLIRPYLELHSIHIKKFVSLDLPGDIFSLVACTCPKYSAIYCGHGDIIEKYLALQKHTTNYLRYPNPFASVRAEPLLTHPSEPEPLKHEIRSRHYTPCKYLLFMLTNVLMSFKMGTNPKLGTRRPGLMVSENSQTLSVFHQ